MDFYEQLMSYTNEKSEHSPKEPAAPTVASFQPSCSDLPNTASDKVHDGTVESATALGPSLGVPVQKGGQPQELPTVSATPQLLSEIDSGSRDNPACQNHETESKRQNYSRSTSDPQVGKIQALGSLRSHAGKQSSSSDKQQRKSINSECAQAQQRKKTRAIRKSLSLSENKVPIPPDAPTTNWVRPGYHPEEVFCHNVVASPQRASPVKQSQSCRQPQDHVRSPRRFLRKWRETSSFTSEKEDDARAIAWAQSSSISLPTPSSPPSPIVRTVALTRVGEKQTFPSSLRKRKTPQSASFDVDKALMNEVRSRAFDIVRELKIWTLEKGTPIYQRKAQDPGKGRDALQECEMSLSSNHREIELKYLDNSVKRVPVVCIEHVLPSWRTTEYCKQKARSPSAGDSKSNAPLLSRAVNKVKRDKTKATVTINEQKSIGTDVSQCPAYAFRLILNSNREPLEAVDKAEKGAMFLSFDDSSAQKLEVKEPEKRRRKKRMTRLRSARSTTHDQSVAGSATTVAAEVEDVIDLVAHNHDDYGLWLDGLRTLVSGAGQVMDFPKTIEEVSILTQMELSIYKIIEQVSNCSPNIPEPPEEFDFSTTKPSTFKQVTVEHNEVRAGFLSSQHRLGEEKAAQVDQWSAISRSRIGRDSCKSFS